MFSHQLYNVVHVAGIALLMAALGGMALAAAETGGQRPSKTRRFAALLHGLGLFLILLGGFGMLARIGIVQGASWPGWVWAKVVTWAILGAAAFLPFRFPGTARPLLVLLPVFAGLAAYLAIYKPF